MSATTSKGVGVSGNGEVGLLVVNGTGGAGFFGQ
jgi:hypothetical protein